MTAKPLDAGRAAAVAAALDVDVDCGICLACLGFVAMAVDEGDEADIRREARRMAPDLWAEGLAEPALAAVRRAVETGVRDAAAALDDLEARGGRSPVARALVRRLAEDLSRAVHTQLRLEERARRSIPPAPELN